MTSCNSGLVMTFGGSTDPAASLRVISIAKLDAESNKTLKN